MDTHENPLKGQELSKSDDWPLDPPSKSEPHQDSDLVSLNVARDWLPRTRGRKISLDTLYRWCQKGLKNGVRLEAVKIGSRWYTTRKWVQDFVKAGKPSLEAGNPAGPSIRTSRQRDRAADWAEKELRRLWKKSPRNPKW
jgi:hypothetical protein